MLRASLFSLVIATCIACSSQAAAPTPPSPSAGSPTQPPPAVAKSAALVASGYDKPPQNVLDVLLAPSAPVPFVSPQADAILLVSWAEYPPLSQVAEPFLRLAGVRVEPRTRRKHDTPGGYGITACAREMKLTKVPSGAEIPVSLPEGGCAEAPLWSADGKHFAFRNTSEDAVELWVGTAADGGVHRVPGVRLNPMLGYSIQWLADQKTLLVKLMPDAQGPAPLAAAVSERPSIQETKGEKGESSTYEVRDTLSSKYDEELFDYYASSQLASVDIATNALTRMGAPGVYAEVRAAPSGEHLLVTTIHRPYSYVTTFGNFARDLDVWDRAGKMQHRVASLPLADRVPVHGVPTGPRELEWRASEPATLIWLEALDGGDWKAKVPARDKVMLHKAPFQGEPTELLRTEQRCGGMWWSEQPSLAILSEYDENRHWKRAFTLDIEQHPAATHLLWDLSSDDLYKNPGAPVLRVLPNGYWVLRQEGDSIFLSGQGASVDGDRPFLDRLDLKTLRSERLFRSAKTELEGFVAFAAPSASTQWLSWHQSPNDPPNAFVRTLGAVVDAAPGESAFASTLRPLTHLQDPTPVVRAIKKRLVKYKRKDGIDLSFTIYTPPGYQEGTRVPAILYAYPRDFADASKAGQVSGSEQTFTRLRKHQLLLLAGYAIIDNASFPIVGDPKRAYDTYLEQLVADAQAAVDKAVEIGVADPERIGVTGHSHGALMTVNLLAHTNLFRAGVATSGAYNKTLTPFGFQNERRSVWEAQHVYLEVSPYFYADKLKLPVLLMHGADDANPGTTPLQSTKLYEALRGNGGTARLVVLPHEPHSYTSLESNEQLAAEMIRWFDQYVRDAAPRAPEHSTH